MGYMITFNHPDGECQKPTPSEPEQHGTRLKEFARALREDAGPDEVREIVDFER